MFLGGIYIYTRDHSEESSSPPALLDTRDRLARDEVLVQHAAVGNQLLPGMTYMHKRNNTCYAE